MLQIPELQAISALAECTLLTGMMLADNCWYKYPAWRMKNSRENVWQKLNLC